MRFSIILLTGLIMLVTLTHCVKAQADFPTINKEHYFIGGYIYGVNESVNVAIANLDTKEFVNLKTQIDDTTGLQTYLFDLANLKKGWTYNHSFGIFYSDNFYEATLDNASIGIQIDFDRPKDKTPIVLIAGAILILSADGLYYYIRRKDKGVIDMPEVEDKCKVTIAERVAVITIFGILATYSLYMGNFEAATGFATTIGMYFLSREGV